MTDQVHKLYKLTDQNNQTMNCTQWGKGVTHQTTGIPSGLCSEGWLHAYEHPLLAVLFNPIHANFRNPRLWEAEGEGELLRERQLKCGVTKLTTVKEMQLPEVTTEQRVRFAILCCKAVCEDEKWNAWADKWLSGEDRSESSAEAASAAAAEAAEAAWAAAWAEAAEAASWAAARVAAWAAWAAAWASEAAADKSDSTLDLIAVAKQACDWKEE